MTKRATLAALTLLTLALFPALHTSPASGSPLTVKPWQIAGGNVGAYGVTMPSRQTGGARFLTLPFTDPGIVVQQGWVYNWGTEHLGIDYVLGARDAGNWRSFDVVAAADGWACGNCTSRQGNAVWIRHSVDGQTYFTYYGHLATIESSIPIGDQQNTVWVQRGQKLGVSGNTGADSVHLHFQVNNGPTIVDPYDLWTTRELYAPGCASCQIGNNFLWTTNPPSMASGSPVAPPPAASITPTSLPTAVAKKPPCELKLDQTVEGSVSDAAPEVRYCLAVTSAQWVSIRMFATKGSGLDTYIKVYGPDGKLMVWDDDGAQVESNSFLVAQLPKQGNYEIVATRFADSTGDYKLRVDKGTKSALGDLNADCVVDQADMQLMMASMGTADGNADLNLDGQVNLDDQTLQLYRLGRGCMRLK